MFDVVTDHVLRMRRSRAPRAPARPPAPSRSSRVCSVCGREIALEEDLFLVDRQVHCQQCHGMLVYELGKEREVDRDVRVKGTKWEKRAQPAPPDDGGVD
jgi:DNA-directed RNA polymerase subunit RPC12/RpoP